MKVSSDGCGCFPTGRHYPGIAHLLRTVVRGLADEFASDAPWNDVDIVLLDVETTGRDAAVDRVVEVGIAVGREGVVVMRKDWLVNPGVPIPASATEIHKITDDDVKDAPTFGGIAEELVELLRAKVPAAYNATFDKTFILSEFARLGTRTGTAPPALRRETEWVDPLVWARELQSEERSRALGDVAARLGITLENAHRAADDAEAAMRVFYTLGRDPRVPRTYGALVQEQRRLSLAQADERRMWRKS
ncbi:hypothetical protein BH09MYX1_BH09MYX1_40370 [soil metagenome]